MTNSNESSADREYDEGVAGTNKNRKIGSKDYDKEAINETGTTTY